MTVGAEISIADANLTVLGTKILSHVPDNVVLTPASGDSLLNGAFIGVRSDRGGSRNVFPIGKLQNLRFMCTFRFKLWWMTQRMGSFGKDIPFETQFLIVERNDASLYGETNDGAMSHSEIYTVFLPMLEGDFRAVLQGNENDDMEICLESGESVWVTDWVIKRRVFKPGGEQLT